MKGWLHLDLIRLLVLAAPVIFAHTALVAWAPPVTRPGWLLGLTLVLAVACLLLAGKAPRGGTRQLGRGYLAFFLAFIALFALVTDMDLLAGPRVFLADYSADLPPNVLGLGWLEDWHYSLAPRTSEAGEWLVVTFPSFDRMRREEVRQRLRFLIRRARENGALGVAFDIYLDEPSQIDRLLRSEVEEARKSGMPVVFGYRQVKNADGYLVARPLPPELEEVAEHRGHLQGYADADGRIRLIPTVLPKVGKRPALSVAVAKLFAGQAPLLPKNRLLRFVPPRGGIDVVPFDPNHDWGILGDRFVFVGSSSENDRVVTPFGEVQGVEVHAWAAHALATGAALVDVDPSHTLPLIFAVGYVLTVLRVRGFRRWALILAALALSAAMVAAAVVVLRVGHLWLEVGPPLMAVWLLTAMLSVPVRWPQSDRRTPSPSPSSATTVTTVAAATGRADQTMAFDVFLSHNGKDKPAVRELSAALEARGLAPWLDQEQLVPGRPWQEALEEIIIAIPAVAVLVGADGLGPWEEAEMRGALAESVRRGLPVIPVLLPGAPQQPRLPLFLTQFTWVDLRGGFTEDGLDRLEWGITGRKPA